MRNLFCHSNPVPRIGTTIAAALLSLAALTACGEAGALEPLDRWRDGEREIRTTAPAVTAGRTLLAAGDYGNFRLTGEALTQPGAQAALLFHTDGESGYEVVFRNGAIDGTRKSGSLASVRNLYRSLADDGEWFGFEVTVRGRNIVVRIDTTEVVCYTEPEHPYRTQAHARQLLGHGVIRFQQRDFPVIDYHVHLKGGLTKERAHAMSMNYGINYGVAPNAGEGGVGRMLADDGEVYAYFDEVERMPFLCGVQGEGRKWTATFSQEALGVFDYLFTDAMTIIDHKGRNSRIYRPEEVHYDGVTKEQYMDHLVDQTVKILTNEPADIYANPTYLPDDMQADYDRYWTDARVDRVLDVLERYGIALEINARYRIPSFGIIRRAKQRGIKFTFGTNNVDADFGRLEYSLEAVEKCGLTADDIWFPAMSVRRGRPVVLYNKFE